MSGKLLAWSDTDAPSGVVPLLLTRRTQVTPWELVAATWAAGISKALPRKRPVRVCVDNTAAGCVLSKGAAVPADIKASVAGWWIIIIDMGKQPPIF